MIENIAYPELSLLLSHLLLGLLLGSLLLLDVVKLELVLHQLVLLIHSRLLKRDIPNRVTVCFLP